MDKRKRMTGLGLAAGVGAAFLAFAIVGLVVVYTGSYNVAATEEHASFIRWAFNTTMHNSVESRADDAAVPESFTPAMIEAGASMYKGTCQHCHAGPGVERAEWASGMRPSPPHLTEAATEWELEEVFWLAKHGVKMTGMPAFGPSHDDETLWNVAAFVKQLPAMTPEQYAAFGSPAGGGHHSQGDTQEQ